MSWSEIPYRVREALEDLPKDLLARSGSVFYSGPSAFCSPSPLYVLGLNPGGSPTEYIHETVGSRLALFRSMTSPWSAYSDESWCNAPPGSWMMQPRVVHMLTALSLEPRAVPSSNVVFARSSNEKALTEEKASLLAACWPVHQAVIDSLGVQVVLCFGGTAGRWVREQLGATVLIDQFRETNKRGWLNTAHQAPDGRTVVTCTHPSRADWRNSEADPTPLVRRALQPLATR